MKNILNPQIISFLIERMKISGIVKYHKLADWSAMVKSKFIIILGYKQSFNKLD